jgi:ABC-type nitrate/sulfonate/bicarbonate transport system permease component
VLVGFAVGFAIGFAIGFAVGFAIGFAFTPTTYSKKIINGTPTFIIIIV